VCLRPGGPTATGGEPPRKGHPCDEGLVGFGGEVPGHATGRSEGGAKFQATDDGTIPGIVNCRPLVQRLVVGPVVWCLLISLLVLGVNVLMYWGREILHEILIEKKSSTRMEIVYRKFIEDS
jgi:hypothetical protein